MHVTSQLSPGPDDIDTSVHREREREAAAASSGKRFILHVTRGSRCMPRLSEKPQLKTRGRAHLDPDFLFVDLCKRMFHFRIYPHTICIYVVHSFVTLASTIERKVNAGGASGSVTAQVSTVGADLKLRKNIKKRNRSISRRWCVLVNTLMQQRCMTSCCTPIYVTFSLFQVCLLYYCFLRVLQHKYLFCSTLASLRLPHHLWCAPLYACVLDIFSSVSVYPRHMLLALGSIHM